MPKTELKPSDYVHLHNHTHYSLLDGLTKVPELVDFVKKDGMEAVAVTDHGTMSGLVELYKECNDKGIKPILGLESYVAARKMTDKALSQNKSCTAQLLEAYKTSDSWEVRLEALHCLSMFADENFVQALMLAFKDQYEHIQRMACIYAGDNGDPRLEEGLRYMIETQDQNVRAQYAAKNSLDCYECSRAKNDKMIGDIF